MSLVGFVVFSAVAVADVGPPPSCPPGTEHIYRAGHHCVPIGQTTPDPPVAPVPAEPAPVAPEVPPAPPTIAEIPPAPPIAEIPPPAAPPAEAPEAPAAGWGCDAGGASASLAGLIAAVALLRRRR